MPRYLPSVGPSLVGSAYIGFLAGALRNHSRRSIWFRHSGVTPFRYAAPNSCGGAFHTALRQSSVSRSHEAPANVLRVIRLVRFGAAPAYTHWSGADTTAFPLLSVRPSTWWHREQLAMNVCSPSAASVPSSGCA